MPRQIAAILLGGLVAATLDIVYAFIAFGPLSFGLSPLRVLQSVAAGWLGREAAVDGGVATAMLGLASHLALALMMAALFVIAADVFAALRMRPLWWGCLYGLGLYTLMNYLVVPLSASATGVFASSLDDGVARIREAMTSVRGASEDFPWMIWGTLFTHTFLVGVPIALIARQLGPASDTRKVWRL